MTRKLTFLILALFTLIAGPGWGQTLTTYTMTIDGSNSGNNNVHWTSTDQASLTWENVTWNTSVTGTTSLTANKSYVQIGSKANPATNVTIKTDDFAGKTITAVSLTGFCMSNEGPTLTVTAGTSTMIDAIALVKTTSTQYSSASTIAPVTLGDNDFITFSINSTANAAICISEITVTYQATPSTTPSITVNPTSIDLGTVNINEEAEATFTVSQANLTSNISLNAENGNLNVTSINFGAGDTQVTYTITPNAAGEFSDVITISCTDLENGIEINVSGTAIDPSQVETYEKVTSADDLVAGASYILVCPTKDKAAGAMGTNTYFSSVDATLSDNTATSQNAIELVLGGTTDAWTFTTSEGLIGTSAAKSLNHTGNGTTTWTISIANDGTATITSTNSSYGSIKYNASSPRFLNYASGQTAVALYKKVNSSSVATPTFTPASGTYATAQNVTITCATEGASIYYTLDGTTPTDASTRYTSAITVSETTTIKAIAYSPMGETSSIASATYTFVAPLTTMDAIFAKATEVGGTETDVYVTFNNWVISGVKGNNAYLTDGTKGLIIYENGHGFTVGDKLTGTAACKVQLYRGAAELTTLTSSTDGLTVTEGGSVTAQEFNINDLSGINTGAIITVNNVTYSGSNNIFTDDDENEIKAYNTFMTLPSFTSGRQYNITGVYIQYDETKEIAPRNEDDIYLIPDTEYAINLLQNDYGTISADVTTASEGQTVTLTATPIANYHFVEWTVLDGDANVIAVNDNNQFVMPASDVEVEATFAEDEVYVITYYYNGELYTDDLAYAGALITLEEDPDMSPVGFSFVGWSTSVASTNVIEGTTYTINADVDFYAVFEKASTSRENDEVSFVKVTEAPEDWSGEYLLVYEGGESNGSPVPAVAWTGVDAGGCGAEVSITSNTIAGKPEAAATLTIAPMEGGYSIRVNGGDNDGKYIGRTADSNGLNFTSDVQLNTLAITDGEAVITAAGGRTMKYNYANNNLRFRYYGPGQQAVQLYKKQGAEPTANRRYTRVYDDVYTFESENLTVEGPSIVVSGYTLNVSGDMINTNPANLIIEDGAQLIQNSSNVMATFQKNITGYTGDNDNYYLIANPTANAVGEEDEYDALDGCTTFDLYTFDPTAELEWVNIGQTAQKVTFDRNVGYLYANAQDMTLHFRGYLLPTNETTNINLVYYTGGEASRDFPGFNLIGNPYTCDAYVNGYNFYTMADGEFVINEGSATIAPCEGFFVEATEANQSVTVSTAAPVTAPNALSLNVSQNRGNVIDRAIVNFNGSNNLHKFMMNPAHTNLSIAKGGETFAAISTEAEGELPVNFKAEKNGTYTITVNTKNVDAEYLHLIDNMTGMDVDLLSTPSYTFEAKTTDYASRFKLVFGVNNTASESSDSNFAFMSDGNLVISNIEGEATLQIVDELGRVISTETVSGSYSKALNLKAGLYILNLNGMTQKIVVE